MSSRNPLGPACPICASAESTPVLQLDGVLVNCSEVHRSREEALAAARGELQLVGCRRCGLVRNAAFDPALLDYDATYENSLHFSPAFRAESDRLAADLVERYDLRGARIIEAGSGKGEFLARLCALGDSTGIGYDPTYAGESDADSPAGVTFVADYFAEVHASGDADFVVCRHVLEHIVEPRRFMGLLRSALRDGGGAYIEVPDARRVFDGTGLWDIVYPHVTYFSPRSLRRLLADSGFRVVDERQAMGGLALGVDAVVGQGTEPDDRAVDADGSVLGEFGSLVRKQIAHWAEVLTAARDAGEAVALWGAGAKGVTFLNLVPGAADLDAVVDLNPRKQGTFVPGTGQEVVAPTALVAVAPSTVLVTNPLYEDEIAAQLAQLGIDATTSCV